MSCDEPLMNLFFQTTPYFFCSNNESSRIFVNLYTGLCTGHPGAISTLLHLRKTVAPCTSEIEWTYSFHGELHPSTFVTLLRLGNYSEGCWMMWRSAGFRLFALMDFRMSTSCSCKSLGQENSQSLLVSNSCKLNIRHCFRLLHVFFELKRPIQTARDYLKKLSFHQ